MGVCVLGTTVLGLVRNNKYKVVRQEARKISHVTEFLHVDMVDRRINMTSIDCSLDMDMVTENPSKVDHVISAVCGNAVI